MKTPYPVTALIELGAGLALLCCPSATVMLLVGSPLETSAAVTLGRVAGAALSSLGVACWLARDDTQSIAARGLVAAMLLYNFAIVAVPRFRRHRFWTARRRVVASGGSSHGDGRLVCLMSAMQSLNIR